MKSDKILTFFWLLSGLLVMGEGYRLNIGELRRPGSGLFPFLIGLFLAVISLISLRTLPSKQPQKGTQQERPIYRNIFLCLFALYAYLLIFEWLGFVPTTFLFMIFLLKGIERKGWIVSLVTAFLSAAVSYLFFGIGLRASLPKGIFGI